MEGQEVNEHSEWMHRADAENAAAGNESPMEALVRQEREIAEQDRIIAALREEIALLIQQEGYGPGCVRIMRHLDGYAPPDPWHYAYADAIIAKAKEQP